MSRRSPMMLRACLASLPAPSAVARSTAMASARPPPLRFAVEGAEVFVTGRHRAELDAVVGAIGPKAIGIQADSSNLSDLNGLYERVKAEAGRIDVLFVNAGGGWRLPLGSIIEQQYEAPRQRNASLTERP
jgi:NADP-dependent 3-hydroxy acid dehydrogenase YdfG